MIKYSVGYMYHSVKEKNLRSNLMLINNIKLKLEENIWDIEQIGTKICV